MTANSTTPHSGGDSALQGSFPALRLDHLERLTDSAGIVQHAFFSVPDLTHGYSIDDQARALIIAIAHTRLRSERLPPQVIYTYLSFLRFAANADGSFHNFLSCNRAWLDERGSDDSQGRALWALGYAARYGPEPGISNAAEALFVASLPAAQKLGSPRTWAFTLFGLHHFLQWRADPSQVLVVRALADRLTHRYAVEASSSWRWFEPTVTYCNGKLPAALLLAYELTGEARYLEVGLSTLSWLLDQLFDSAGRLRVVGQNGWFPRGGAKAAFDEQCVDAQGTIEAALIASRITGQAEWRELALAAFSWFHGRNVHGLPLVDTATGGCYDALTPEGRNQNMGAESIICYLLAYLDLVDSRILTLDGAAPSK